MRLTTLDREIASLDPRSLDKLLDAFALGDAPNQTVTWAKVDSLDELSPRQVNALGFAHTAAAFSDGRGPRFDLDLSDIYPEMGPGDFRKLSPRRRRMLLIPIRGGMLATANFSAAGLTAASTAYTAGDMLGTEVTWTGMAITAGDSATILSGNMLDNAKVVGAVDLMFFTAASTPAADNAAESWSDANRLLQNNGGAMVQFGTPLASALNSLAQVANVGKSYNTSGSTSMFGNGVTRIGHTFFGAATDLKYSLDILYD